MEKIETSEGKEFEASNKGLQKSIDSLEKRGFTRWFLSGIDWKILIKSLLLVIPSFSCISIYYWFLLEHGWRMVYESLGGNLGIWSEYAICITALVLLPLIVIILILAFIDKYDEYKKSIVSDVE